MSTDASPTSPQNPPPHWTLTAAALLAFVALGLNGASLLLLALLGAALIATHLSRARLSDEWWLAWLLRLAALGLVLVTDSGRSSTGVDWLLPAGPMRWFGQMCAAELVLQRWRKNPTLGKGGVGGIFLSALVLMAASNTPDVTYFRVLAPAWVTLTALALPYLRADRSLTGSPTGTGGAHRVLIASLAATLLVGAGLHFLFANYLRGLDSWALTMLAGPITSRATGFGAAPTLGASYDLQQSPQRVLRLQPPPEGLQEQYLRGMAFNTYSGGRWLPALGDRQFLSTSEEAVHSEARGPRVRAERLVGQYALLFLPLHVAGFRPPEGSTLEWADEDLVTVRASVPPVGTDAYEWIESSQEDHQGPLCWPLPDKRKLACLDVPREIDSRVLKLARGLVKPGDSAAAKIQAVERYLMSHHQYSLRIRPGPGDPVSAFLLQGQSGHCQFFGSAAVILLRSVGVPARYVQGYFAHEGDSKGRIIVRSRDAHAWAEAWVPNRGWVTVDATPGDGRPDQLNDGIPPWLWLWEWLQEAGGKLVEWLSNRRDWLVIAGAVLLTLFLFTMLAWNLWRRQRGGVLQSAIGYSPSPAPELAALAARFERVLERLGVPVTDHRPWGESALVGGQFPPLAREVLNVYNEARFGPTAGEPQRLDEECRKLHTLLTLLEVETAAAQQSEAATDNGTDSPPARERS